MPRQRLILDVYASELEAYCRALFSKVKKRELAISWLDHPYWSRVTNLFGVAGAQVVTLSGRDDDALDLPPLPLERLGELRKRYPSQAEFFTGDEGEDALADAG